MNTKVKYIVKFKAKNLFVKQNDGVECILDNSNKEFVFVRGICSFGDKYSGVELVGGDSYLNLISDQVVMFDKECDAEGFGRTFLHGMNKLTDSLLRVDSLSVVRISVEEKIMHTFNLNSMKVVSNCCLVSG